MRRCPYLEEYYRESRGPLQIFHFDCHVDKRSKRKISLGGNPPICVRNFEDCHLYREEKRREDDVITRYTD